MDYSFTSIVNGFQKIISKGRKLNKIWVDQRSEFCNNSFRDFLEINNIEMYSTFNEGKFSVPKDVGLNSTHYLIMKTNNIRELQNIAIDHSADIDYNDFMKI